MTAVQQKGRKWHRTRLQSVQGPELERCFWRTWILFLRGTKKSLQGFKQSNGMTWFLIYCSSHITLGEFELLTSDSRSITCPLHFQDQITSYFPETHQHAESTPKLNTSQKKTGLHAPLLPQRVLKPYDQHDCKMKDPPNFWKLGEQFPACTLGFFFYMVSLEITNNNFK